jgi:hypothetical protein
MTKTPARSLSMAGLIMRGYLRRPQEDGDQFAIDRETWSEAVDEFRPEVSMRRSTLSFFEQLLAALPSAEDSPARI